MAGWLAGALAVLLLRPVAGAELPDIIDQIRPGIVAVGTVQPTRRPPVIFRATGFAVGDGWHVLTNAHALPKRLDVSRNEVLAVFAGRGERYQSLRASAVAVDREHDLALLKIEGTALPPLRLGGSGRVREGQEVAFTGFPIGVVLGLFPVTHRGLIAALTPVAIPLPAAGALDANTLRRLRQEPYTVFQLDATAYPGNSGSPLFEPHTGRVIGVINKVFVQGTKETLLEKPSGITYAIPIEHAQALLKQAGVAPQ